MNKPLLSVIIPIRGRYEFAVEAINSVYHQQKINPKKFEIILVEHRQDPKFRIIRHRLKKKFPQAIVAINEEKEGPGGKRNTGLKYARGKYIAFLDSDDIWKHTFFSQASKAFTVDNQTLAVLSLSHPIFSPKFPQVQKLKLLPLIIIRDLIFFWLLFFNNSILPPTGFYLPQISHLIFRRKALTSFKFDYHYRHGGEDWALFAYILDQGQIKIIPQRLVKFRYSLGSSTMTKINRRLKWQSYVSVLTNLSPRFKTGLLYHLFLIYIRFGKVKQNAKLY